MGFYMDIANSFINLFNEYGTTLVLSILLILIAKKALHIVPQSEEYIVERLGKYSKTFKSGINILIPFLESVRHKISILERRLDEFSISVITRDNVEIKLVTTVFFRVNDSAKSVYRIRDVNGAIQTAAESIIRSAAGKLELDDVQSAREKMSIEILDNLREASNVWGVEITRTEITDVIVDQATKQSQRQQLNAERERRAAVAKAEGEKRSVELAADAKLYEAMKTAEAVKISADADAYSITVEAEATAKQTTLIANAINNEGESAIQFEVLKQQVEALSKISNSGNTKTVIIPTDVTKVLGSLELISDALKKMTNYFISGEGWLLVGLVLLGLEILTSGYIFLAFGIGSLLTYALLAFGLTLTMTSNSFVDGILLNCLMSVIALIILKLLFNRKSHKDINEY